MILACSSCHDWSVEWRVPLVRAKAESSLPPNRRLAARLDAIARTCAIMGGRTKEVGGVCQYAEELEQSRVQRLRCRALDPERDEADGDQEVKMWLNSTRQE